MAIPQNIIDQVQDRTDIVEVISRYISLKKIGRNYKTTCPFHHEKTPSFIVSPDKQIYHCFGCGAGGNVFSFLMKHENIQFPEAVEMLAEKAGVALGRISARSEEASSLANELYKINDLACKFYQAHLLNNKAAREYLSSRGVGDEVIKKFRIGYAPDSWDATLNFFKSKGVSASLLEKAGLVIPNEKGSHYDRFRNRILFPIMDLKDRILGFGGRVLDSSLPKYINSPETPVYSKGRNLYGLNLTRDAIKKKGYALIVEGYLDFIIPYQAGVQNIIATLGTALTVDHVKLLKRLANTLIMVYDPDEAGEAASLRGLELLVSEDVNVYIAELPSGFDPDGYIRKFGTEEFTKLLKASKNLFEYKFAKLSQKFNANTTHGKANIAAEMLQTIAKIKNAVSRSDLIKKLAERLSVDEDSLRIELKKVKPEYAENRNVAPVIEVRKDSKSAEVMMLALSLGGAEYISKIEKQLSLEEFKDSSVRDVMSAIFDLHKDNKEITAAKLINYLGNRGEDAKLISEAVNLLDIMEDKEKALNDCVAKIKKDNMDDRRNRLQEAIRAAHKHKDEEACKKLLSEYNDLLKTSKAYTPTA